MTATQGSLAAPVFTWRWVRFEDFTASDLYDVLALRSAIFVVEQACVFLDADGADRSAFHLMGHHLDPHGEPRLGAYLRFVDAGIKYPEPSIGRVVVAAALRGLGCGAVLMREGIARAAFASPDAHIVIGAQQRLERFYRDLGFLTEGPPYLEDGIDHVQMRRIPDGAA